jgi:zinc protease
VSETAYLSMLFKGPAFRDADAAALKVLAKVLFAGRASRFNRILVRDLGLVSTVGGGFWGLRDPSPFTVTCTLREQVAFADVETAVDRELDRVRTQRVSDDELERAKAQILLGTLASLETTRDRSHTIGAFEVAGPEGWRQLETYLQELALVTPEDVRRVAETHLVPRRSTVVWQHPPAWKGQRQTIQVSSDEDLAPSLVPPMRTKVEHRPRAEPLVGGAFRVQLPNGLVLLY